MPFNRLFLVALLSGYSTVGISAIAYPQVEMDACINSALPNVLLKGLDVTPNDVEKYCDCALRKIIDEDKGFKASTEYCNAKFIFKSI